MFEFFKTVRRIETKLDVLLAKGTRIMTTVHELQQLIEAEGKVIASAITLINGLANQVAALKPDQAAIDALAGTMREQAASLAAAVAANTASASEGDPAPSGADAPGT